MEGKKGIDVNDRLPDYGVKVIVWGEMKGMNPQMGGAYPFMTARINLKGTSGEKEMERKLDPNHFNAAYVTHWRPLPPAPQINKTTI